MLFQFFGIHFCLLYYYYYCYYYYNLLLLLLLLLLFDRLCGVVASISIIPEKTGSIFYYRPTLEFFLAVWDLEWVHPAS